MAGRDAALPCGELLSMPFSVTNGSAYAKPNADFHRQFNSALLASPLFAARPPDSKISAKFLSEIPTLQHLFRNGCLGQITERLESLSTLDQGESHVISEALP